MFCFFSLGNVKLSQEQTVICKQCAVCTVVMVKVVKRLSGSQGGKGQEKKRDGNEVNSVKNKGGPHECQSLCGNVCFFIFSKFKQGLYHWKGRFTVCENIS